MKRSGVRRLLSISLRRDKWASEVEEEILTHLTIRAERLVALGMSPQAARDEAIRRFGPLDESRERMIQAATHREQYMRRREAFDELRQDLGFAFRTLTRNKGWAAVAVITLALGIAATSAVWSAATTLLLHPLPYPAANRIVNVNLLPTAGNSTGMTVSIDVNPNLIRAWQTESRVFETIEPYASTSSFIGSGASAQDAVVTRILPSFVAFAGQRPLAGRVFTDDEVRSKAPVAMIGEGLWRRQFGASASVIGQSIRVAESQVRIVGVMPMSLVTPRIGARPTDVWIPADLSGAGRGLRVIARLRPGVTPAIAAAELDTIAVRSSAHAPAVLPYRATLTSPGESVSFRDSLVMLTGAVLFVLLVAAANVAHLLLARGLNRRREIAIRTAMGASRGRIMRQMMTETIVLSAAGCTFGATLGWLALEALVKYKPPTLPELGRAQIDGMALSLAIGATMICAIVFGAIAAMGGVPQKSASLLRAGSVSDYSRRGERMRSVLVVTEMALSAMLLVGATLLVRTVVQLQQTDLGFDPTNLHVVSLELPHGSPDSALRAPAVRQLAEGMKAIPGVKAVTLTDALPSYRNFAIGVLEIQGKPRPTGQATSFIDVGGVNPSYFATFGAHLVQGRMLDSNATSQVVINESFARKQWGEASPIGQRIRVFYQAEDEPWSTIVGVVRDVSSMGPVGERAAPFLYVPLRHTDQAGIVYRTDGREATVAQVLALARRTLPQARTRQHGVERIIDNAVAPSRFIMLLMSGFTVLALVLAAVGLYGMMSYAVAQRTREIGIRIALGATRHRIARSVVGRGARLGIVGAGLGLLLALWATRVIEGSLYGVDRLDAASFAFGGVGLIALAVAACIIPTWRAIRVDPLTSIRAD
jgi:predicted permease